MTIWFSSEFIKLVFGADANKKGIQEKSSKLLCAITVPHYLHKPPGSLKDFKYFKASELRTWLFVTALPVLEDHMKEPYLGQFKKFVYAISLLNMESVSVANVHLSKTILINFVREWKNLYALRQMSFNIHIFFIYPTVFYCLVLYGLVADLGLKVQMECSLASCMAQGMLGYRYNQIWAFCVLH